MTGKDFLLAAFVSGIVAIPMALASSTFAAGNWSGLLTHPGFWVFLAKAAAWFFLAGLLASVITMVVSLRKRSQAL